MVHPFTKEMDMDQQTFKNSLFCWKLLVLKQSVMFHCVTASWKVPCPLLKNVRGTYSLAMPSTTFLQAFTWWSKMPLSALRPGIWWFQTKKAGAWQLNWWFHHTWWAKKLERISDAIQITYDKMIGFWVVEVPPLPKWTPGSLKITQWWLLQNEAQPRWVQTLCNVTSCLWLPSRNTWAEPPLFRWFWLKSKLYSTPCWFSFWTIVEFSSGSACPKASLKWSRSYSTLPFAVPVIQTDTMVFWWMQWQLKRTSTRICCFFLVIISGQNPWNSTPISIFTMDLWILLHGSYRLFWGPLQRSA